MAIGADDIGDDIEIGNKNYCTNGTTLMLDNGGSVPTDTDDEAGHPFVLRLRLLGGTVSQNLNGIEVQGFGQGSAVVADQTGAAPTRPAVRATNNGGTAVSGVSSAKDGVGVFGAVEASQVGGTGVWGEANSGRGVFGRSLSGSAVEGHSLSGSGVYGKSSSEWGVVGVSSTGIGVSALSTDGVALHCSSTSQRAGVFSSGVVRRGASTSEDGIAQVRLVPASEPNLPTNGSIGDLFAHQVLLPHRRSIRVA
jgi:hypothetical protein